MEIKSVFAAAAIVACLFGLAGCNANEKELDKTSDRFVVEKAENNSNCGTFIITDTETGVQYLYLKDGRGGGLVMLQEAEE